MHTDRFLLWQQLVFLSGSSLPADQNWLSFGSRTHFCRTSHLFIYITVVAPCTDFLAAMPGIPDRHTKRASFFFPFCPPDGILITNLEKVKPLPHPGSHRKIVYETDLMECQRSARLHAERLRRIFTTSDADIFCIQESKLQEGQIDFCTGGYCAYWNYAQKRATPAPPFFTRKEPLSVHYGIGIPQHDTEDV